ncbi:MAG: hypothetical protein Q8868_00995 [Bacteroidota bacterium]|nr:hypothetical protein [Bacteroidota bacterium]
MTKPEVGHLKHEDVLNKAIINTKDKAALSWWWLVIPFFIILMFLMKSFYMPGTTFFSGLQDFIARNKMLAYFFFIIIPVVLILINTISIRKIYYLEGRPELTGLFRALWVNIAIIGLCIVVLIIYFID